MPSLCLGRGVPMALGGILEQSHQISDPPPYTALTHCAEQPPIDPSSSPQSPVLDDNNTLAVPTRTSRAPSASSTANSDAADAPRKPSSTGADNVPGSPENGSTDPLRPDPGEEELFNVSDNPFAFSPGHLSKLMDPKNLDALAALGGLAGLEKGLRTDRNAGLSVDEMEIPQPITFEEATAAGSEPHSSTDQSPDAATLADQVEDGPNPPARKGKGSDRLHFTDRKRVYGINSLPERKSKSLLELAWIALQDRVLILLSIAAVVSLALGLYQTFGNTEHEGAKVEWVEGVAIVVAIFIVVAVGALNDYQKERQFRKLNKKKEDRFVKVIRSGKPCSISIYELLVGDVMLLEAGDVLPVDGVCIAGQNVSCDESSATGESDLIKKVSADEALSAMRRDGNRNPKKADPFLLSGARVLDGVGTFLVTAVGPHSTHGKTMMSLRDDPGLTPLQLKLNILAGTPLFFFFFINSHCVLY